MTARFAELVAATNYSFLRGASHPADMVGRALELGMAGIGIADRNSVAGVVRAWVALNEACEEARAALTEVDFRLIVGARLVFADATPDIIAYPATRHGWGRLTRLLTVGNRRAEKGDCILRFADLIDHADDLLLKPGRARCGWARPCREKAATAAGWPGSNGWPSGSACLCSPPMMRSTLIHRTGRCRMWSPAFAKA